MMGCIPDWPELFEKAFKFVNSWKNFVEDF
jgi:hypothetical protein